MKKICLLFLACLFLCACSHTGDITASLDTVIDSELSNPTVYRQDQNTIFFSYYLPSDIYKLESYKDATIFSFNNEEILMNMNITSIIASEEGNIKEGARNENFYSNDRLVYSKEGTYLNHDEIEVEFIYNIYAVNNKYLISFKTDDMNYYAYVSRNSLELLTKRLFMLAESMSINSESVVAYYANVDMIDYTRKQVNLFETVIPREGQLEEILIDKDLPSTTTPSEN